MCFTKGVLSGKNDSTLYMKVIPDQLENGKIENFVSKQLSLVELNWNQYINSCLKIKLCSPSCKFSREVERHFDSLTYLR